MFHLKIRADLAQFTTKGSERTCIRSGLATFLHDTFTAHSDLVVDSSPHMLRTAQPLISRRYTTRGGKTRHKITSTISIGWNFTTKSGGVWVFPSYSTRWGGAAMQWRCLWHDKRQPAGWYPQARGHL